MHIKSSSDNSNGVSSRGNGHDDEKAVPITNPFALTGKLQGLADAHEKRLITDAEFSNMRKQLLDNFATQGW